MREVNGPIVRHLSAGDGEFEIKKIWMKCDKIDLGLHFHFYDTKVMIQLSFIIY